MGDDEGRGRGHLRALALARDSSPVSARGSPHPPGESRGSRSGPLVPHDARLHVAAEIAAFQDRPRAPAYGLGLLHPPPLAKRPLDDVDQEFVERLTLRPRMKLVEDSADSVTPVDHAWHQ